MTVVGYDAAGSGIGCGIVISSISSRNGSRSSFSRQAVVVAVLLVAAVVVTVLMYGGGSGS